MKSINLKQLLLLIYDSKDMNANLNLDEGCLITAEEQTTLVKALNYCINYLSQLTERHLEIGLELRGDVFALTLMAITAKEEMPAISENIAAALKMYKADIVTKIEPSKYFQIVITFKKE
jgi:hypothetical protein